MDNFYEVKNIRQIIYTAEETHPFIELTTPNEWDYCFYVGQPLIAITDTGEKYNGILSAVENDYFIIQTDDGKEVSITFYETYGIIGKPDRE